MKAIIKSDSMVVVNGNNGREKKQRTEAQLANEANLTRGERNGFMSYKTKANVKTLVDIFLFLSQQLEANRMRLNPNLGYKQRKCHVTFCTLTLPSEQKHDDKFIRRYLLDKFIRILKDKYGVTLYLWVAEAQANGNIHYHILLDKFIENVPKPKYAKVPLELTKEWNKLLNTYGYIQAYAENMRELHKNGFVFNPKLEKEVYTYSKKTGKYEAGKEPIDVEKQFQAYLQGEATNWSQPNTVDIHKLKDMGSIKGYVCKYLCKNDGSDTSRRKIESRLWGCANELKNIAGYEQPFDDDLQNAILDMQAENPKSVKTILITDHGNMDPQTFDDNELEGQVKVFATVFCYSQAKFWKVVSPSFKQRFEAYYKDIFRQVYSTHPLFNPVLVSNF